MKNKLTDLKKVVLALLTIIIIGGAYLGYNTEEIEDIKEKIEATEIPGDSTSTDSTSTDTLRVDSL